MLRNIILSTCLTVLLYNINAQPNFQWAVSIGASGLDWCHSITSDASGNVYTTGRFTNTVDFDPGPGTYTLSGSGSSDIYVSKLNGSGNFVWAVSIGGVSSGGVARNICLDALGNVYVIGDFLGTVDFDPGPGTYTLSSASGSLGDIFIVKLSATGNFIWARHMGGTSVDYGQGITVDASGNVYTTGKFSNTADFDPGPGTYTLGSFSPPYSDAFISKLDASGNFVWAKQVGNLSSSQAVGMRISLDQSGNIYAIGNFSNTADFDPGGGTYTLSAVQNDIYILKLDGLGNFAWVKQVGNSGADQGHAICLDASGNIYATGYFSGTVDFDPGPGTSMQVSAGNQDAFILKLDASGNFTWAKAFGGIGVDISNDIDVDASGNVYAIGQFPTTVDFDPGPGTYTLTSAGAEDVFVLKLDASGNFDWAAQFGGSSSDIGTAVKVHTSGDVYTSGHFKLTADFDPHPAMYTLTATGTSFDIFVHKMGCSSPVISIASQTNVSCYGGSNGSAVVNASGGTNLTYTWMPNGGNTATISGLPAGSYTCTVMNDCGNLTSLAVTILSPSAFTINTAASPSLICVGASATLSANASGGSGVITYSWTAGPAGSIRVVSPASTTIYTVTVTDAAGCTGTANVTQNVNNCAGVFSEPGNIAASLNVYPNPGNGLFTIEAPGTEHVAIRVINALGQVIYEGRVDRTQVLDLSNEKDGIYMLNSVSPYRSQCVKLIKR